MTAIWNFRDINSQVADALRVVFRDQKNASVECGDIFSTKTDALVSPANSFGRMDGGIDYVYLKKFGNDLEERVREAIALRCDFRELLVGQAITVETKSSDFPKLIVAPTMRIPGPTTSTNVYLAARAAFAEGKKQNFKLISCPGLGTWSGRVPASQAALAMRQAWHDVFCKKLMSEPEAA